MLDPCMQLVVLASVMMEAGCMQACPFYTTCIIASLMATSPQQSVLTHKQCCMNYVLADSTWPVRL